MKRALVVAGIVVLGILVWPRDRGGIVLGEWSGSTTQDRWVKFLVDEGEEGLEIAHWGLGLELTCLRSKRVLHGGLASGFPIPIHDRRFHLHQAGGFVYIDWSGVFSTAKSVEGVMSVGFPTLTGEVFDELDAEVCKVGAVGFAAHPGDGEESRRALDFEIVMERDGAARWVWRNRR